MTELKKHEFWFVVGSQLLYGAEVLETVAKRANEMAACLSESLPCKLVYKATIKSTDEATQIMKEANFAEECCGVVSWCHTFSPSKMWIEGLRLLQKPYCHFATQYNRSIPDDEIDMDFMNLNQSAHGDREHGFIGARMRMARKVIVGYWKDEEPIRELGEWMRAAVGFRFSRNLRILRFGDNMREVAVTEGDKVEAQIKLGWMVNTWPVGYLVEEMAKVTEAEIDTKMAEYRERYAFNTDDIATVRYQALEEVAMKRIFEREKIGAFSNTFQDLYGMKQLPGLASQNLMADRIGYGGEGDWKVAGMTAVIMAMTEGMSGGTTFIEDYTYNLEKGKEYSLGAHMLEVGPSIAAEQPKIEVHPLGIGDREAPARLVFEGKPGKAIVVTLIDMGGRMRMILQDIECVKPIYQMRNLPVARVMWKAMPDLCTGAKLWILAGGAHHSVLSYDVSAEMLADFAEMNEIEFVHITKDTTVEGLKQQMFLSDLAWKLRC
ncbi:MAG: L-arabinose isomerase [Clostridiaceae bacterium]